MSAADRARRTQEADALCAAAFADVGCPETGVALVAVGGFGRGELAPYSDLDVLLVCEAPPGDWAGQIWYPLWDSGATVDHAVRSYAEVLETAAADLRVALGLLDLRQLAGDPNLTLRLRSAVLTQWRRDARARLPELRELAHARAELLGELAHASVPNLKESTGGLRDATVLKALVATWLVDVPHADLERSRQSLLDVRDALHQVTGRAGDRVAPDVWPDLARALDLEDAAAAQRRTRAIGRRITHISRLTWRRADAAVAGPARIVGGRRPMLDRVAPGVARSGPEIVLDTGIDPAKDPLLLLRAAAEAAERDLVLSPSTAARLVRDCPPLPLPWPPTARDLFVRLLASGRGLLGVWETLDETGAIATILPEWERVRLLPHASVVHRFTVDRHLVETCIEASMLIRRVSRPDVLMVAALLHDIGKGELTEHCAAGAPIARTVAVRLGFDERETDLVETLVRRHLLLPETATTRDPEDPATVETVVRRIGDRETLELLAALTEADAKATSEKAWTSWRSSLVRDLVARVAHELGDPTRPATINETVEVSADLAAALTDPGEAEFTITQTDDGAQVWVVSRDRVGLLADVAAVLALQRVSVRAARAWVQGEYAVSVWEVDEGELDASVLRQRFVAITSGRLDPRERLQPPSHLRLQPAVSVRPEASERATVLEVRSEDQRGLIYLVCTVLAEHDISVRSAHLTTLGPQAVDVFYVQERDAAGLSDYRAADAAHAVRAALASGD